MSELEDRISSILNSPEEMSRITQMAQSLMGGASPVSPPLSGGGTDGLAEKLRGMFSGGQSAPGAKNDSLALLEAMTPFLGEKRCRKMSRALQITRAARLAGTLLTENGEAGE